MKTTLQDLDNTVSQIKDLTLQLRDYLRKDPVTKSINRHLNKLENNKGENKNDRS